MQFHGYDKDKRELSVEFTRDEAEGLRRVMQGIADNLNELEKAAMGVYSHDEAMVLVKDMDRVLEAFAPIGKSATVVMREMRLLDYLDALSGLYGTENNDTCLRIGMSSQNMQQIYKNIREGMRAYTKAPDKTAGKKKLNNLELL